MKRKRLYTIDAVTELKQTGQSTSSIIQFTIRKYGVRLIAHIIELKQQQRQSFKFN